MRVRSLKLVVAAAAVATAVGSAGGLPSEAVACQAAATSTSMSAGGGPPLPIGYEGRCEEAFVNWYADFNAWADRTAPDPPPTDPDLTTPECAIDDPRAPRCIAGDTAPYTYQATNPANQAEISNVCIVTLDGATPSDPFNTGRVQFRAKTDCDYALRAVTIETKLVDALGATRGTGPTVSCHGCGQDAVMSSGDVPYLGNDSYQVVATVRMVLEEGQPPGDPWMVTPGAPPADTSNGTCTPLGTVVKCELRLATRSTTA